MQPPIEYQLHRHRVFGRLKPDQTKTIIQFAEIPPLDGPMAEFFSVLEGYLKTYTKLIEISFKGSMSEKFAQYLGTFLARNNSIKILIVEDCDLTARTFSYIAEGLKENKSVVKLDAKRNRIGDEGISALAKLLHVNTTIRSIDLWCLTSSGEPLQYFLQNRILFIDAPDIALNAISQAHNAWNVNHSELIRPLIRATDAFVELKPNQAASVNYDNPAKLLSDYLSVLRAYSQNGQAFQDEDGFIELTPDEKTIYNQQIINKINKTIKWLVPLVCGAVLELAVKTSINYPAGYPSLMVEIKQLFEFLKATGNADVAYEQFNKLAQREQDKISTNNLPARRKALLAKAIALTMIAPDSHLYGPACYALAASFIIPRYPAVTLFGAYRHLEQGVAANDGDCKQLYENNAGELLATNPSQHQPIATLRNPLFTLTVGRKLVAELKALFEVTIRSFGGITVLTFFGHCMPIKDYLNQGINKKLEYNIVANSVVQALADLIKATSTTPEYLLLALKTVHLAIAKMRREYAHDHEHAPIIEAADQAIAAYLENAMLDPRPALIQNAIWRILEEGREIVKKDGCNVAEKEIYSNEALKKMLDLNAYHPESAKTLLACGETLCSKLIALPENSLTDKKAIVRELQSILAIKDTGITESLSVAFFDMPEKEAKALLP